MDKTEHLDTIWEVPDELWTKVEQVLAELDPPNRRGRPRVDARRALNGIISPGRRRRRWRHRALRESSAFPAIRPHLPAMLAS